MNGIQWVGLAGALAIFAGATWVAWTWEMFRHRAVMYAIERVRSGEIDPESIRLLQESLGSVVEESFRRVRAGEGTQWDLELYREAERNGLLDGD